MKRLAVAAIIIAIGVSGCFHSREISSLERDFARMNPELSLRRNFVLNIGPGTMHLLERAAGAYDGQQPVDISDYLGDIDRVKVGIYDIRTRDRRDDFSPSISLPQRDGWSPVVVVRDGTDATSIHYRETGRAVRDLLIINASTDQFVVVRLQGNLGRLLLRALDDRERIFQRTADQQDDPTEPSD
jgi:hypothetical protein